MTPGCMDVPSNILVADIFSNLTFTAQFGKESLVPFSPSKTKLVTFHHHGEDPNICINHNVWSYPQNGLFLLEHLLCLNLTSKLKWIAYIRAIRSKK